MMMSLDAVHADSPRIETSCVFPFAPGNKPNYRIPAIIQAPNGDILIICEKRNDGIGDIGNHDIVLKRSSDNGKTWSAEQVVFDDAENTSTDITIGYDRQTKKLWLFFLRDKKKYNYFTSIDSGLTWQGPVSMHDQVIKPEWEQLQGKNEEAKPASKSRAKQWASGWTQRYGCGPGNAMIQLESGRLLVPARHREDIGNGKLRSFAHCFFSDDHGASWKLGGNVGRDTSECQFVELSNGNVRVISRNESSNDSPDNLRHLTAISHDGGKTWTNFHRLEELITPRCHGAVERFDAKLLLFSSPAAPLRQTEHPYGRYNLTVRLSSDDGESWSAGKTIWPHPSSYSDIVVLDDQSIAVVYERGNKGSTHYWDELHFVRFDVEWFENRRSPAP